MTAVSFHFNAVDRLQHACRVLRKAATQGIRVFVLGDRATLEDLDHRLWVFAPTSFVSHHWASVEEADPSDATAVLGERIVQFPGRSVLLNLSSAVPEESLPSLDRVIEIVSGEDADRAAARVRWRTYVARGCTLEQHDLRSSVR